MTKHALSPLLGMLLVVGCASAPARDAAAPIEIAVPEADEKAVEATSGSPETQCEHVSTAANAAVTEIERISAERTANDADVALGMRKIGDAWEKLAMDIDALQITSAGLRDTVRNYRLMSKRAAVAARKVANAHEAKDSLAMRQTQKEYDETVAEEDALVDRINAFCQ